MVFPLRIMETLRCGEHFQIGVFFAAAFAVVVCHNGDVLVVWVFLYKSLYITKPRSPTGH